MPKEGITRNELSQLLLVYMSLASDIIDLLSVLAGKLSSYRPHSASTSSSSSNQIYWERKSKRTRSWWALQWSMPLWPFTVGACFSSRSTSWSLEVVAAVLTRDRLHRWPRAITARLLARLEKARKSPVQMRPPKTSSGTSWSLWWCKVSLSLSVIYTKLAMILKLFFY